MMDGFAHMRPYREDEVPGAVRFLLDALDWEAVLAPFLGKKGVDTLISGLSGVKSVDAFQENLSKAFFDMVLERTADTVTFSFPENFDPKGALFISNHRDIVLDPSLINMALLSIGAETTEIGIGSNLLATPWIEALVRLNKSFIVQRGGGPREQLASSSEVAEYVRFVVGGEQSSVWLAHREGRAKDGDDRTSPALIRMLMNGEDSNAWNALRVHPVTLSYEWDPCDAMKVRELLIREWNDGAYEKDEGEDERSMKQGLFGWKGGIHVAFGAPVYWVEGNEIGRPHQWLAEQLDGELHDAMKPWPSQHWAAQSLIEMDAKDSIDWPTGWLPSIVSDEEAAKCEKKVEQVLEALADLPCKADDIRKKWCEITARPLLNQQAIRLRHSHLGGR